MRHCVRCEEEFADLNADGACPDCAASVTRTRLFQEFARSFGLTLYPDPDGDRYVYHTDGKCAGKKGENVEFMDELWNALVRVAERSDLTVEEE